MIDAADGITILKRYGQFKTACWILENNGEAAVVEMPPYSRGERPPYEAVASYTKKNRLYLKYALLSHPHWDHCHTLPYFRDRFPQTSFVIHRSFLKDSFFRFMLRNVKINKGNGWIIGGDQFFDQIFDGDIWQGYIGGEPIYLIYAPKHSYSDLLIIFKGAMITGDWYMGDLKDCNDLVNPEDKIRTVDKVKSIVSGLNYGIHMLFSAHGDCLFYDADFYSIMDECKRDHGRHHPNLRARYSPSGRGRKRA